MQTPIQLSKLSITQKGSAKNRSIQSKTRPTKKLQHKSVQQAGGQWTCPATAAGGGGGDSGAGGLKGLGGEGEGSGDNRRKLQFSGWEARVAADPQFVYKVLVEQIIGVGAAVVGDMSSRPFWGLYELDFVFSTLVVASILNFSLMYLLAPTASVGSAAPAGGLLTTIFSDRILKSWGAPGGHMFQAGFSLSSRLLNLGYKGGIFALVGLTAGLIGTSVSNGLIAIRKRLDPEFVPQNELPNLPLNAACWAAHMGVSSNVRYQILNGFEMVLGSKLSPLPFRLISTAVRVGNNVAGGISFVLLAKILGVQTSKGDEIVADIEEAEAP